MPDTQAAFVSLRGLAILLVGTYAWLTGMVLPSSLKVQVTVGLLGALLVIALLSIHDQLSRRAEPVEAALAVLLFALYAVIAGLSPYGISELSETLAMFAACLFVFHGAPRAEPEIRPVVDVVYWAATGALALALVTAWRSDSFVVLSGFADKNYSAVLLFLFFCYCMKRRHWLGVALSLAYLALQPSRVYVLMIVLFWILRIMKDMIVGIRSIGALLPLRPWIVALVFAGMLVAAIVLSPLWVARMVGSETTAYRMSLNDTSNAMRALGNVYAMNRIASDPAFLLYGYDEQALGILGLSWADRQMHTQFNSYRLVQPHHSVLNLVLKYGFAFSAVYLTLLAWLLSQYLDERNLEYWVPYLTASMFMHSLLSGYLLLLWMYVLSVNEKPSERRTPEGIGALGRWINPLAGTTGRKGWGQ